MNIFRRTFKAYNALLVNHRLKVQAIQIASLMGIGDAIAQKVVEKKPKLDVKRTLKFMSLGLVLGPLTDKWMVLVDNYIGREMTLKNGIKKAFIDQAIANPIYLACIVGGISIIEGKNFEQTKQVFKDDYVHILLASYMIWPFFQIINFTFVPSQYRVVSLQGVEILWNTYLSWKTH